MELAIIAKLLIALSLNVWAYRRGWYDWFLPRRIRSRGRKGD